VSAAEMIEDTNRKRGADWAEYSVFTPSDEFVQEMKAFEEKATTMIDAQYER
jgi:hypothetical protein